MTAAAQTEGPRPRKGAGAVPVLRRLPDDWPALAAVQLAPEDQPGEVGAIRRTVARLGLTAS